MLKKVSSVFQENFIKSFKGVSRNFQRSFVLPFCCSMNLIAATRAEGGLVIFGSNTDILVKGENGCSLPELQCCTDCNNDNAN